jgi:hypothetical protein
MTFYTLVKKMGMDIHQIIELWTGLSPHLARAIPGREPAKDECITEACSDEENRGGYTPVEARQHENGA